MTANSQVARVTTANPIRRKITSRRRLTALAIARRSSSLADPPEFVVENIFIVVEWSSDLHLILQVVPNLFGQVYKLLGIAGLRHIARPCQGDIVAALNRSRPFRQDHNTVGQGDRFLDVVGDEDDRGFQLGPQTEML